MSFQATHQIGACLVFASLVDEETWSMRFDQVYGPADVEYFQKYYHLYMAAERRVSSPRQQFGLYRLRSRERHG